MQMIVLFNFKMMNLEAVGEFWCFSSNLQLNPQLDRRIFVNGSDCRFICGYLRVKTRTLVRSYRTHQRRTAANRTLVSA